MYEYIYIYKRPTSQKEIIMPLTSFVYSAVYNVETPPHGFCRTRKIAIFEDLLCSLMIYIVILGLCHRCYVVWVLYEL